MSVLDAAMAVNAAAPSITTTTALTTPAVAEQPEPPIVTLLLAPVRILTGVLGLLTGSAVGGAPTTPANPVLDLLFAAFRRIEDALINRPPTATPTQTSQTADGVITGQLNATDRNGDPLTYRVTGAAAHGTVTVGPDGTYRYAPDPAYAHGLTAGGAAAPGADAFTVTVDDSRGWHLFSPQGHTTAVLVNVNITPQNHAPTLHATPTPNPDGSTTIAVTADDVDHDPLTTTASSANGGTLTPTAAGFSYTPSASGTRTTDTVTINTTDGHGATATTTVTIPTFAVDPATGAVTGNVNGGNANASYTVTGAPQHGTVTVSPDGKYTYVPTVSDRLTAGAGASPVVDEFTVTARDGSGVTTAVTISVPVSPARLAADGTITVAGRPFGVAVSPDGTRLWVANSATGTVDVIDTGTRTVSSTVTAVPNPGPIVVSADGRRVYVLGFDPRTSKGLVAVIDTATNTRIGDLIPVGTMTSAIAVSPDGGRVYACNYGDNTVSVIDTATNSVVGGPISVGPSPYGIAVSPDGRRVYVTSVSGNSVSVIDTATNTVVGSPISAGTSPYGVAVSPDGQRVYVTNVGAKTVSVVDAATNSIVGSPISVGTSPYAISVSPDGGLVYVLNVGDKSVSVIDAATNSIVGSPISVGTPYGMVVSPDNGHIYVTNPSSHTVTVISVVPTTAV